MAVMARDELDLARLEQGKRFFLGLSPALKERGTDARTPHRALHVLPGDGRTGMKQRLFGAIELGDNILGDLHVHKLRLRLLKALADALVGLIDTIDLIELVEQMDHALVAACLGLPGVLDALGTVLAQRLVEALHTNVDNARLGGQKLHDGLRGLGQRAVVLDLVRNDLTVFLDIVDTLESKRGANSAGVAGLDDGTGLAKNFDGAIVILRIVLGAHNGADELDVAALRLSGGNALGNDRSELGSHIGVAAVAEHAIEHDDARGLLGSVIAHHLDTNLGINHGMRAALGIHVVTKVDNVIAAMAQHVAVFLDDMAEVQGLGDHHGSLAGKGAAGIQADDGLVLAERSIDDDIERLGVVLLDGLTTSKVNGDARGLLEGVGEVDLTLVRLGFLANEDGDDGLGALLQKIDNLIANLRRRRLGDNTDNVGRIMMLKSDDGVLDGDSANLLVKVAAARADCVHAALAQAVDYAGDLLDTGSRGTNDADVAGINDVGKCHGDTRDDASAAVGTHKEQTLFMSLLLQAHLILQGDIIRKGEDVEPQIERAFQLGSGILARNGEEGHIGIGKHCHGLFPARRLGRGTSSLFLYRKVIQECLGLGKHRIDDVFIFGLNNDDHVTRACGSRLVSQKTGGFVDVFIGIGAHHNLALNNTIKRIDFVGQQHQVDRILISILLNNRFEH